MDSSNSAFVSTQEMAEFDSQLFGNTLDANEAAAQQQAVEPSINTVKRRLHLEEMGAARSRDTRPWSPFSKKPKSTTSSSSPPTDVMNLSFHPVHTSTQEAATAARTLLELSSTDSYTEEIAREFAMNPLTHDDSPPHPPVNAAAAAAAAAAPEIAHVTLDD